MPQYEKALDENQKVRQEILGEWRITRNRRKTFRLASIFKILFCLPQL